jgi:hypothetical protein
VSGPPPAHSPSHTVAIRPWLTIARLHVPTLTEKTNRSNKLILNTHTPNTPHFTKTQPRLHTTTAHTQQTITATTSIVPGHTRHTITQARTSPATEHRHTTIQETLAEQVRRLTPPQFTRRAVSISNIFLRDSLQWALAPLVALPVPLLRRVLADIQATRSWSNSTLVSRVNTLLAMQRSIGNLAATGVAIELRRLRRDASQIQTPSWEPDDPNSCLTPAKARVLWDKLWEDPILILPLVCSWILGQRCGDVLLWRTKNVNATTSFTGLTSLSITVVEGKTIPATGPFTLHMPHDSEIAAALLRWKETRGVLPYLFLPSPTILDNHADTRALARAQQQKMRTHFAGDLRSLRRGGLVAMSMANLPDDHVRTMSRHTDAPMLRRYLAAGRLNHTEAALQMEAVSANELALLSAKP